jgi:ATP-dependent DNA ligase
VSCLKTWRPLARRRRAEATALPTWIKPQLTKLVDEPPDGPEWLHEIKFDGYRTCTQKLISMVWFS